MRRVASGYGAGLLFGVGLVIAGMTDPRNVVGFLDVTGDWRPNLAAVMVGAIAVHAGLLWVFSGRRGASRASRVARSPGLDLARAAATIDARLVLGSAVFGVGWGISGYCPGPALVSLGFGAGSTWIFVAALVAGTRIADWAVRARDVSTDADADADAATATGR